MAVNVLRRPLITEKASVLREQNKFVVEVDPKASKNQIREAVKSRFKVDVLGIQTIKLKGKFRRRMGPQGGYQPNRKKAIIQLKAGQQIAWDESAS